MLKFHVMRYNPADPGSVPHLQTYELEQTDGMTLFIALSEIREKLDPSLQFDFVCRAGICGSCAMVINGRPGLACRTLAKDVGPEITLAPLPVFELIGDLSVNTGNRCIECGCCVSACGTARMRDDFIGAVGINKIARFRLDPRDDRSDADYYEVIGDDSGVFGCMSLLGCHDVCPKDLPLQTQIAFVRRKMVGEGLK
ncbi:MAG: 2Fe-2S iron-sulfur cluster-binding protein [Burkholderiaceae bacterium]|nr:2Fe-2S iron-sulfur cluster-binding protein [Burkholderiaceae bacterium]